MARQKRIVPPDFDVSSVLMVLALGVPGLCCLAGLVLAETGCITAKPEGVIMICFIPPEPYWEKPFLIRVTNELSEEVVMRIWFSQENQRIATVPARSDRQVQFGLVDGRRSFGFGPYEIGLVAQGWAPDGRMVYCRYFLQRTLETSGSQIRITEQSVECPIGAKQYLDPPRAPTPTPINVNLRTPAPRIDR